MKVAGSIITAVSALLVVVGLVHLARVRIADAHALSTAVGGVAVPLVMLAGGIALFRSRPAPPQPTIHPPVAHSWIDKQFLETSTVALVLLSILLTIPTWVASIIGMSFGHHPQARRTARTVFFSISGYILVCLLIVVALALTDTRGARNAAAAETGPEVGWPVPFDYVRHNASDFSVRLPPEWRVLPDSTADKIDLSPVAGQGTARISIKSDRLEPGQTLRATIDDTPTVAQTLYTDFVMIKALVVRLNGYPAAELEYSGVINGRHVTVLQFVRLTATKQYFLTFAAGPDRYDALRPVALAVAMSMHVPGDPPIIEPTMASSAQSPRPALQKPVPPSPAPAAPSRPQAADAPKVAAAPDSSPARSPFPIPQEQPLLRQGPAARPPTDANGMPPGMAAAIERRRRATTRPGNNAFTQTHWARPRTPEQLKLTPPPPDQMAEQLKTINAGWAPSGAAPQDLLSRMTGGTRDTDGVTLGPRERLSTSDAFVPPVTFRIVALTNVNDLRLSYAASQIIFNWEMIPTELRVDGGPGRLPHKPGVGALTPDQWVGIEMTVTTTETILRVDGQEIYREPGDFSAVRRPLGITSHTGTTKVHSVTMLKP